MKGFVMTPDILVDRMVERAFLGRPPTADHAVLDPGCGTGAFIEGIARWCKRNDRPMPRVLGIEMHPGRAEQARARFRGIGCVSIETADFLLGSWGQFDYVIGNPPYVPLNEISEVERRGYRKTFRTAVGRFDLYILFFEAALKHVRSGGRIVFVTPEKYLYVRTAALLRDMLAGEHVTSIELIDEATFVGLTTYPAITSIHKDAKGGTAVTLRNGERREVRLPAGSDSWLPTIYGMPRATPGLTLMDVCARISCGVATGADSVFVRHASDLTVGLRRFAFPTVAGRDITPTGIVDRQNVILVPYDARSALIQEDDLGELGSFLAEPDRHRRLVGRTCVRRKPWYSFHENPPLRDILRPKLLCRDITAEPHFVADERGTLVPRHSVYYVVPSDSAKVGVLREYLNSTPVRDWLVAHCQRAANGFLRLQSHVLQRIPLPGDFAIEPRMTWAAGGEVASA